MRNVSYRCHISVTRQWLALEFACSGNNANCCESSRESVTHSHSALGVRWCSCDYSWLSPLWPVQRIQRSHPMCTFLVAFVPCYMKQWDDPRNVRKGCNTRGFRVLCVYQNVARGPLRIATDRDDLPELGLGGRLSGPLSHLKGWRGWEVVRGFVNRVIGCAPFALHYFRHVRFLGIDRIVSSTSKQVFPHSEIRKRAPRRRGRLTRDRG